MVGEDMVYAYKNDDNELMQSPSRRVFEIHLHGISDRIVNDVKGLEKVVPEKKAWDRANKSYFL